MFQRECQGKGEIGAKRLPPQEQLSIVLEGLRGSNTQISDNLFLT